MVDGGRVLGGAQRLVGHRGPHEPDEFASDRDVGDRRALAVLGEVAVSVMQPDLGLPGTLVGWRARSGKAGSVAVVPRGLDQQPAGVAVPRQGDVPTMLLRAGGVLAGGDPQPRRELPRMREP